MRVEVAIAKGDPQSPQAWAVSPTVFMVTFTFDGRQRIGWFFQMISMLGFDHDDIMVLMIDNSLNAAQIERVRQVRDRLLPMQRVCLLDGGVQLANLSPAQIRARVG
jgi:hypothetical protein